MKQLNISLNPNDFSTLSEYSKKANLSKNRVASIAIGHFLRSPQAQSILFSLQGTIPQPPTNYFEENEKDDPVNI